MASKILDFLIAQIGNSGNIYWNWCTDNLWPSQGYYVDGMVTPWCAEFVTCMLLWTGSSAPWFPSKCAFDGGDIPISERYYNQSIKSLDVIAFDWDKDLSGDHVAIVLDVFPWGCRTIDGNSSTVVSINDRYWDSILFGIRPSWNTEDSDIVTEEDKRDIARLCAEYIYGDEDKRDNLNMYNASHWSYRTIVEVRDLLRELNEKIK